MPWRNPFTPSFGIVPAYLAGRDIVLGEMARAFQNGIGDPNLATVIIGARGSGKTALLACIGDEARSAGWLVTDTVAAPGMPEDILQRTAAEAAHLVDPQPRKHLSGVSIGQIIGLELTVDEPGEANWRTRMSALLDELGNRGIGLAITVDEVDPSVEELIQLASLYQLFVRERRQVALVMAGLPKNATDLVDNPRVTFLRRTRKRFLGRIGNADVKTALRRSFESTDKDISDTLLDRAVQAAGGFPYMIQLVGYDIWSEASDASTVSLEHVDRGIALARAEFAENVLRSTVRDMSPGDMRFALAMLENDGPSRISDIARSMGKGANYASTYKTRLLKQGVIDELSDGRVFFAIPFLDEYLAHRRDERDDVAP